MPLTVNEMMHITITSFHTNLHANISYLLDVDPPPPQRLYGHPKFKIRENTLVQLLDE